MASEASGVRRVTASEFSAGEAYVLTDGAGNNRYPARNGTDGASVAAPLTAAEVRAVLANAFDVMAAARAQIRQPLDSRAQVSISVVDSRGQVLGLVRSPDAPIFGIDVSLQKARTAAFLSGKQAGSDLLGDPSADVRQFVGATRTFLGNPNALTAISPLPTARWAIWRGLISRMARWPGRRGRCRAPSRSLIPSRPGSSRRWC